jgi:hypothetical protein
MSNSRLSAWKPYYELDAQAKGLLPYGWQAQIAKIVRSFGYKTVLTGDSATSREHNSSVSIEVVVTDGISIVSELPWLWNLYRGQFMDFAAEAFSKKLFPASDVRSAVNINSISGVDGRYEWHVDSNPVTGLLFVSDLSASDGGALVFRDRTRKLNAVVRPRSGRFLCFDARDIPHRVAPLRREIQRLSVPMNYYESSIDQPRPSDLDDKLYKEWATR